MGCYVAGMRPRLILVGAFVLVALVGGVAFVAAGSLARYLDPSANESHLSAFIVAVTAVALAVASAFPIFGRLVPWAAVRLEHIWPVRPPSEERSVP
jgi:hypothetical protein